MSMARAQRRARRRNEKGVTAVEYGLLVAILAAAIILTLTVLEVSLTGVFTVVSGTFDWVLGDTGQ